MATDAPRRSAAGFTLLEILVVVVLVAILASLAVLSIRGAGMETKLREEARRLQSLIGLASEEAIVQGRDLGLLVDEESYSFHIYVPETRSWASLEFDRVFRERQMPATVRLELWLEGADLVLDVDEETETPVPQIVMLSSGELTPFEITLESDSAEIRYAVEGLPFGRTELRADEIEF